MAIVSFEDRSLPSVHSCIFGAIKLNRRPNLILPLYICHGTVKLVTDLNSVGASFLASLYFINNFQVFLLIIDRSRLSQEVYCIIPEIIASSQNCGEIPIALTSYLGDIIEKMPKQKTVAIEPTNCCEVISSRGLILPIYALLNKAYPTANKTPKNSQKSPIKELFAPL